MRLAICACLVVLCVGLSVVHAQTVDLDLSLVKARVMKELEWTSEKTDAVIEEYKKFWLLHLKYPRAPLVPSQDVDEIWHAHILHTEQYFQDCNRIFGSYFHHRPALDAKEEAVENVMYRRTLDVYQREFGHSAGAVWTTSDGDAMVAAGCGAGGCQAGGCSSGPPSCSGDGTCTCNITAGTNQTSCCCKLSKPASCSSMMAMTFHWSGQELVLFDGWITDASWKYFLTIVFLAVLVLFKEWLFYHRQCIISSSTVKERSPQIDSGSPLLNPLASAPRGGKLSETWRLRFVNAVLAAISLTLGYFVMLVVMTYNSGFFLTIILAAAVGSFLFSVPWSSKAVVSSGGERSDCCEQ